MGQQQLLLIVLGVIIVGIAVVVGINVFNASSYEANQDAVVNDLTNLATMAQQHAKKPEALGGGGGDFSGWSIPTALQNNANTDPDTDPGYDVVSTNNSATPPEAVMTGIGSEEDENGHVQVWVTVYPDSLRISHTAP